MEDLRAAPAESETVAEALGVEPDRLVSEDEVIGASG